MAANQYSKAEELEVVLSDFSSDDSASDISMEESNNSYSNISYVCFSYHFSHY